MGDVLEERKKKLLEFFKSENGERNYFSGKNLAIYSLLGVILLIGYLIRIRNLPLLRDVTTGKFIPADLDAFAFLRYAKYVLEHGNLMNIDYMRYYPWGYPNLTEFSLLSHFIVYLYKFLHFFNSSVTLEYADVLYPPIAFVISMIFFFLLVKKLFDYKIALLSTLILSIIPIYLNRSMAGWGDKEALAMVFWFAAFYFFIAGWESDNLKSGIIYSILSGISTGLMIFGWGGYSFVVTIIGFFVFMNFVLIKFEKNKFYQYSIWYIIIIIFIFLRIKIVNLMSILGVYHSGIASFAFLFGLLYLIFFYLNLFKIKDRIERKIPAFLVIIFSCFILIILILTLFSKNLSIIDRIREIYFILITPFGMDRWQLTVAESHQPYFMNLIGQIGWKYFWVFFSGAVLLSYNFLKEFNKKYAYYGIILYAVTTLGLFFSRYSTESRIWNGETNWSIFVYFSSLILLISSLFILYLIIFKKNKDIFNKFPDLNYRYLFILVWLFFMILASRSAIRLLMVLAPVIAILVSYLCFELFNYSLRLEKKDVYKMGIWILIFLILLMPFSITSFAYGLFDKGIIIKFYKESTGQAKYTGSIYNQQWQVAGKWIRENTPKDAVFAHWWDYGYLVQTGGERATITDGGNYRGSLNHMMGRYVLTGQNEIEALEFLKVHNATNLLIISDEIGKYPAFSSIGADENWDRYSWINVFTLDRKNIKETREGMIYIYTGSTPLDWDFTYKGQLFPKGGSGIIGFFLPVKEMEGGIQINGQPTAILIYNGKQYQVPLECVFINGKELAYPEIGLKGCLQILPKFEGNNVDPVGAGIYISEKVRKTLFAQLYLFSKPGTYFKEVYNDQNNMPLAFYNGRIIGPLKIWEINYPLNLKVPEIYYRDELPNMNVTSIKGRY